MADRIEQIAEGFWNIRGSFKVVPLLDIGTQMSLVKLKAGGFALLDSYALKGNVHEQVMELTDGGKAITAILNLHPFHTIHVKAIADLFPDARLYGTRRHIAREPELRWEKVHTEDAELKELFRDDFMFSVPQGVDFIPDNENLHFASVLALHSASRTLHVDDTLMWTPIPFVGGLTFHPTLAQVLEKRAGAVNEFRKWVADLEERCQSIEHICTAHFRPLPKIGNKGVSELIQKAMRRVDRKLKSHERRYG